MSAPSTVQQEESRRALIKLLVFTFFLAFAPISTYFLSLKYYWNGNTTWSALSAVVAANVVLITFVVQSVRDDSPLSAKLDVSAGSSTSGSEETKKTQ